MHDFAEQALVCQNEAQTDMLLVSAEFVSRAFILALLALVCYAGHYPCFAGIPVSCPTAEDCSYLEMPV